MRSQKADLSLSALFDVALPVVETEGSGDGYFVDNDLLVRKWVPYDDDFVGEPVVQLVVPEKFRGTVLKTAHDEVGHRGIRRAYDCVLRSFFWPKLRRDVANYVRTCHTSAH